MIAVVQAITVSWTKASRGAPAATKRNAVREAFPISRSELLIEDDFASQHIIASEVDDFHPVVHRGVRWQTDRDGVRRFGCCYLRRTLDALVVRYQGSQFGGAPTREPYGTDAFELVSGTWGRLRYNGRFSGWHDWWYEKTVLNIALVSELASEPFAGEPDILWSHMADLR